MCKNILFSQKNKRGPDEQISKKIFYLCGALGVTKGFLTHNPISRLFGMVLRILGDLLKNLTVMVYVMWVTSEHQASWHGKDIRGCNNLLFQTSRDKPILRDWAGRTPLLQLKRAETHLYKIITCGSPRRGQRIGLLFPDFLQSFSQQTLSAWVHCLSLFRVLNRTVS